jgi:ChaC-like protein
MTDGQNATWVFGYGSLIWGTGAVETVERREGILPGWHREWTWISKTRHGAPTCSLKPGGQVRGIFLHLDPRTTSLDLEEFRRRENRSTEQTRPDTPAMGAVVHFWTMGSNLEEFSEFQGLQPGQLARVLADRARTIAIVGPDGVLATDYIRKVHEFDPDDAFTAEIVGCLVGDRRGLL